MSSKPDQIITRLPQDLATKPSALAEALTQSEERYRSVVDNLVIGVTLLDKSLRVITLNRQMREWFPQVDVDKRPPCYKVLHDPPMKRDHVPFDCPSLSTLRTGKVQEKTMPLKIHGESRIFRILASPVKNQEGQIIAAIEMMEDITDRSRAEEELAAYRDQLEKRVQERTKEIRQTNARLSEKIEELQRAEQKLDDHRGLLRELASEVSLVEERERRRLAQELHDGLGQTLAMARMKVAGLKEECGAPDQKHQAEEVLELVKEMIQQTRSLIWEMGSPELFELGLPAALEGLAEDFSTRYDLECEVILKQEEKSSHDTPLSDDLKITLFQMTRELLTNVVKHGHAEKAEIHISLDADAVRVLVRDNGHGFDPVKALPRRGGHSGFGLFSIRERLKLLGGSLDLDSAPGRGTKATLTMPVNNRQHS